MLSCNPKGEKSKDQWSEICWLMTHVSADGAANRPVLGCIPSTGIRSWETSNVKICLSPVNQDLAPPGAAPGAPETGETFSGRINCLYKIAQNSR